MDVYFQGGINSDEKDMIVNYKLATGPAVTEQALRQAIESYENDNEIYGIEQAEKSFPKKTPEQREEWRVRGNYSHGFIALQLPDPGERNKLIYVNLNKLLWWRIVEK